MNQSDPIILVPGLGTSPRTYANILPALWRRGSVTIANQTEDDSMEVIAGRILAAAPPRFVLIGHSMGGYITFEIMRQAAARVSRLALLNTSARPDSDEAREKRKKQIEKVASGEFAAVVAGALPAFVHPSHKEDKNLQEIITAAHNDAGAEAYMRQQKAIMGRADSRPDLEKITIPALVLTGDGDSLIPLEPSQEMADAIPGAKLVILSDCGHMPPLEQPQGLSAALEEWLEG